MGQSGKKKKQTRRINGRELVKREPPNQEVLDSIGSPNAWTPEIEDAWLQELRKIPSGEIHRRFAPMKKPPSVRKRGKGSGWGGTE